MAKLIILDEEIEEEPVRHHYVPYHPAIRPEGPSGMLGELPLNSFLELDAKSARWRKFFLAYLTTISALSMVIWFLLIIA